MREVVSGDNTAWVKLWMAVITKMGGEGHHGRFDGGYDFNGGCDIDISGAERKRCQISACGRPRDPLGKAATGGDLLDDCEGGEGRLHKLGLRDGKSEPRSLPSASSDVF